MTLRHARLFRLALFCAAIGLFCARAGAGAPDARVYWPAIDHNVSHSISVGPNVMVSRDDADAMHAELYIAADPTNVRRLVACGFSTTPDESLFDQSGQWDNVYASNDGGASWHLTRRSNKFAGDPSCEFDRSGRAYFLASIGQPDLHNVLYHSDDGGYQWSRPFLTGFPYTDEVTLVPDRFAGGKFGRLYFGGQVNLPLIYSDDGGVTFKKFDFSESPFEVQPMHGAVLPDGSFVWPVARGLRPKGSRACRVGWPTSFSSFPPQVLWLLLLLPAWWSWRLTRRPDSIVFSPAGVLARGPRSGSWIPKAMFALRNLALILLVLTLACPLAGARVYNQTSEGINIGLHRSLELDARPGFPPAESDSACEGAREGVHRREKERPHRRCRIGGRDAHPGSADD